MVFRWSQKWTCIGAKNKCNKLTRASERAACAPVAHSGPISGIPPAPAQCPRAPCSGTLDLRERTNVQHYYSADLRK